MSLAGNDLFLHIGLTFVFLLYMGLATSFSFTWASTFYLAFLYIWAFTLYPAFSYTWALDHLLLLLPPKCHRRAGHFMDTQIRLNIFVICQRCFLSPALQVFSIRMHPKIISTVFYFWHFEYSADVPEHSQHHFLFLALQTLILRLCHLDLRLLCRPHPSCL